mgnify:CR=1 FL=1
MSFISNKIDNKQSRKTHEMNILRADTNKCLLSINFYLPCGKHSSLYKLTEKKRIVKQENERKLYFCVTFFLLFSINQRRKKNLSSSINVHIDRDSKRKKCKERRITTITVNDENKCLDGLIYFCLPIIKQEEYERDAC